MSENELKQFTFQRPDGSDVILYEGSRLEWDLLAGIAIPGAGTCTGIGESLPVVIGVGVPLICIQIDPNDKLRELVAKARSEPFYGIPSGLDGEGGFYIMVGDAVWRGVCDGTIRVLDERRAPETYKPAMAQWNVDYQKRAAEYVRAHRDLFDNEANASRSLPEKAE